MKNRGSEWKKWDLHIHSPLTHGTANKYGDCTVKQFCDNIIENDISVIGLTNYFYIKEDEYNEVRSHLDGKCLVIPNFEFRASDKNKKGDYINFHILFNPKIEIDEILTSIGRVKLHNHSDKFCCEKDIRSLSIDSICIDFEQLINNLKTKFKIIDDFIVVCPYTGYGGFKHDAKPRNISTAKKYDINSHCIFGNITNEKIFLSKRDYSIGDNVDFVEHKKSLIQCSDAHCAEDINKHFTWIKADASFDGLKQIIFEPEQRVKIQKEKPDFKESKLVIEELTFTTADNKFTHEPIFLNDNLNVIIGGKSSGKSILLYNIARTLLTDRSDYSVLKYKNPDTSRYEYKYSFGNNFDFIVKLKSGTMQSLNRNDDDPSILPEIKYIPQNYLSELAERKFKKNNELNKLVRDLLLEDETYCNEYDLFISKVKSNDTLRENLINNYFEIKDKVVTLQGSLNQLGNKDALNNSIKINEESIIKLKSELGLSDEQINDYNELNSKLQEENFEKTKISNDFRKITTYNRELINSLKELKSKKDLLISSLENDKLKAHYSIEYDQIDQLLISVEQNSDLLKLDTTKEFLFDNIVKDGLSTIDSKIKTIEESLKPLIKNISIKEKIQKIESSIFEDKEKLNSISQRIDEINLNQRALKTVYNNIFELYSANFTEYSTIISSLKNRIQLLEDDNLQILGLAKYNFKKFRDNMLRVSNATSRSYKDFDILADNLHSKSEFDVEQIIKQKKEIFNLILDKRYILLKNVEAKSACKVLLDDYFYDYWEVSSNEDTLYNMSTGKASFVILKLIIGLSKSKSPILIDQPEDNLDNRSITKDLVSYLKDKKLERQIILVTHNPNVVVNADSENVVVANQKGQNKDESSSQFQFDYINGSLENTFSKYDTEKDLLKSMGIREHIADIVEGGKEAFKSREMKYRFS
ncbi:TrlF family AAA-like ATPase [Pontibacter sp. CAU 1760]